MIHLAYLFKQYEIGHWLIKNYPKYGLETFSPKDEKVVMPFTGENILHMAIVRREYKEVRWILDFYSDHKYLDTVYDREKKKEGIEVLLHATAQGTFFQGGDFYFGTLL